MTSTRLCTCCKKSSSRSIRRVTFGGEHVVFIAPRPNAGDFATLPPSTRCGVLFNTSGKLKAQKEEDVSPNRACRLACARKQQSVTPFAVVRFSFGLLRFLAQPAETINTVVTAHSTH